MFLQPLVPLCCNLRVQLALQQIWSITILCEARYAPLLFDIVGHQQLIRTKSINNDWNGGLRGVRSRLSMRFRWRVVRRGIEVARAPRNSSNSLMALDGLSLNLSARCPRCRTELNWTGKRRKGPPAACFIVLWCANNISALETNCAARRRRIRGQLRRLRTHDTVHLPSINRRLKSVRAESREPRPRFRRVSPASSFNRTSF